MLGGIEETANGRELDAARDSRAEQEQTLTISPEKVCFIIIKAKEYDSQG
jgi:hypothetical protein